MLALGLLIFHFCLGESIQKNLIWGSTANKADFLCFVFQALGCFLHRALLSIVVGPSVWALLLPSPFLWYLKLGLDQLKWLLFGFAQGDFPLNGTLRSLHWKSLTVEWTVFYWLLCLPQATRAVARVTAVLGGFHRLSQQDHLGSQLWPELMQYSHPQPIIIRLLRESNQNLHKLQIVEFDIFTVSLEKK